MKSLFAVVAFVCTLAACGAAPASQEPPSGIAGAGGASVEAKASALYTPDNFWYGTQKNVAGQYTCQGGQWWLRAGIDQGFSVGQGTSQWSTTVHPFTSSDGNDPTVMLDCTYSVYGTRFSMVKGSGLLYNDSQRTCTIYSHAANDPGGWFNVGGATVPAAGLQYFPNPDRWVIDVYPYAGVGLPGFCPHFTTTLYPS